MNLRLREHPQEATGNRPVADEATNSTGPNLPGTHTSDSARIVNRPRARSLAFPALVAVLDGFFGLLALALVSPSIGGALYVLVGLVALKQAGSYRELLSLRALDAVPRAAMGLGLAGLGMALGAEMWGALYPLPGQEGLTGVLTMFLVWTALLAVSRAVGYLAIRSLRRRGVLARSALIVGINDRTIHLTRTLLESPSYGIVPVGFIAVTPPSDRAHLPIDYVGTPGVLSELIDLDDIENVIIDASALSQEDLLAVVEMCNRLDTEVFVIPSGAEVLSGLAPERVQAVTLFRLPRRPFRTVQWRLKRVIDVIVASAALVVLSPIMAVAGLAVTRETKAGLIFRQSRVGLDGRPFDVLKFQTMVPATQTESQTQWNIANDARLGPVGRFLRRTSIDELPQLFNVLRGDMSLVGPRPERPHFVEAFASEHPRYRARHRVPSGLTGFAQVEGLRGDTSIAERVAFDNLYIEQWSLWLDFKIVLRTIPAVLRGDGG